MTHKTLTTLALRIAGIYLFTKIFDHFGAYFFSIYGTATMIQLNELVSEPINKFYVTGTLLTILNIIGSLFLFIKADWIADKLVKNEKEIKVELNPKSLTKVILLTIGVIWLAKVIYLIPDLIEYATKSIARLNGNKDIEVPDFAISRYILKVILTFIILFQIEKISDWIVKRI